MKLVVSEYGSKILFWTGRLYSSPVALTVHWVKLIHLGSDLGLDVLQHCR